MLNVAIWIEMPRRRPHPQMNLAALLVAALLAPAASFQAPALRPSLRPAALHAAPARSAIAATHMRLGVPPPAALAPPALAFLTGRPRGALVAVVFAVAAIIAFLRRGGDAALRSRRRRRASRRRRAGGGGPAAAAEPAAASEPPAKKAATDVVEMSKVIAKPIDEVFATVSDFAEYPNWVTGLSAVEILETDPATGLAKEVTFKAGTLGVSISYTLRYDMKPPESMTWVTVAGDVERIDGAYKLTANDDGTTSVAYALEVDPGFAVPGFLRKTVTKIVVGAALPSLKKYLERK